jgi:hypothetical protein
MQATAPAWGPVADLIAGGWVVRVRLRVLVCWLLEAPAPMGQTRISCHDTSRLHPGLCARIAA